MKKLGLFVATYLFLIPSLSWGAELVYKCQSHDAAGYQFEGMSWEPARFTNGVQIRILKKDSMDGLIVQKKKRNGRWQTVSGDENPGNEYWIFANSMGREFIMKKETRRFSYTSKNAYLNGKNSHTPYLTVGTCEKRN